jgi:hypothetical protein
MIGFSMCPMAATTYFSPAAPPGKKLIRYHSKPTNCAAEADMTRRYPDAPPKEKVAYNVTNMDPKYRKVK